MEELKNRKMLGIIGGMGPEASCYFYENVIAHTKAEKDQEHIDMVLLSHASMPDRTEAIRTGDDTHLIICCVMMPEHWRRWEHRILQSPAIHRIIFTSIYRMQLRFR